MLPASATRYDIARNLGDNRVLVLTHRQSNAGAPVDHTGLAAEFVLYARTTGTELATLTTSNSGIAILGATGEIRIDLGYADYAALPSDEYRYRINLIASGLTRPLLRGIWKILGNT